MKNKKGFTLVELMAVIIILGILLTIAIPNTLAMLERNKKDSFVEDAKKFISLTQAKVETDKRIEKPKDDMTATLVTMKYLNNSDLEKSPYGFNYMPEMSFVIVTRSGGRYVYYVNLIACKDASCAGNDVVGLNVITDVQLQNDGSRDLIRRGDVVTDFITYNSVVGTYDASVSLRSKIGNRVVNNLY